MYRCYTHINILLTFVFILGVLNVSAQINQRNRQKIKDGKQIGYYPDGTVRYEGFFIKNKPNGMMKRYYPGGMLKADLFFYQQGSRSRAVLYDKNGKLFAKGNYIGIQKDSIWNYYTAGDVLLLSEAYKNGLKSGRSQLFYPGGKIFVESEWENGQMSGAYKKYSITGKLIMAAHYLHNRLEGLCVGYNESGQEEVEGNYKANVRDGAWTYYTQKGKLRYVLNYKNGILQNPQILDGENKEFFNSLEKSKLNLKDPEQYRYHPEDIMSDDGK